MILFTVKFTTFTNPWNFNIPFKLLSFIFVLGFLPNKKVFVSDEGVFKIKDC